MALTGLMESPADSRWITSDDGRQYAPNTLLTPTTPWTKLHGTYASQKFERHFKIVLGHRPVKRDALARALQQRIAAGIDGFFQVV
jgi:hypothetical protein